jgi:hypothetical protein
MADLGELLESIVDDQFDWGEFGRSDDLGRSEEMAAAKPNFFISCQAVFALVAVEGPEAVAVVRFLDWVRTIRAQDLWWTSAVGSASPRGVSSPGAVHNLRHTAKGLDVLVCQGALIARDAPIVEALLAAGKEDGSWPAYEHSESEIWATAYVLNLLARLLNAELSWLGTPEATLRSRIDAGLTWMVEHRDADGLWSVPRQDQIFTTEAVLAEVGGLLAARRADVCNSVARELLGRMQEARRPTATWALALVWYALEPELQAQVAALARATVEDAPGGDVLDLACQARLTFLEGDVAIAAWLCRESGGHESALPRWAAWNREEYHRWCIRRLAELQVAGAALATAPSDKAEAWKAGIDLVERWANHVEQNWRTLWNGDEHVDEAKIQENFATFASGADMLESCVFREVETGRGPVDFVFVNGVGAIVYMEFKRGDHAKLVHGGTVQLPTYMGAARSDTGLLVCVAFDDDDVDACAHVAKKVEQLEDEDIYTWVICVDARRKPSASTA